ncbi:MAG: Coenzyme F420 hydrogenase/dehydrogenase, beta subunit C-terminal domain [Paludibacteraceae bacterium]|jgi:coenzyme F420-reducing hydrogenase beta subunit|nr:Coenzyme F420 hydrogenase/dehydrogenase, beta subunit C-terminal domain [Paludibacteraceae bacterium]
MIQILDKHNCCGCSACSQTCPRHCISFEEDNQGFRYPSVDTSRCIDCGLCEKVCPCINHNESREPICVYAAINPDEEVRMKSSSGGMFSLIAESVINDNGIVFGARFDDNWEVMHDYAETKDGLDAFRGSKYLQSLIGGSYKQVQDFLKQGKNVLFSGTGCQIAGLKKFLRKEYENLLTVEIVCHSVPSPLVWRKYLKEKCENNSVKSVNFRDKTSGWSHYSYSVVIHHEFGKYIEPASGPYMKGLTSNLTTRPSCSQCPTRFGKSGADIVLGDCWGVWDLKPEMNDSRGVSIVETFSSKGLYFISKLNFEHVEIRLEEFVNYNSGLGTIKQLHKEHDSFFMEIGLNMSVSKALDKYLQTSNNSFLYRVKKYLLSIFRRIK